MKTKKQCIIIAAAYVLLVFLSTHTKAQNQLLQSFSSAEINGYVEARSGWRVQNDPYEKDISVMETRLQLECFTFTDLFDFKYKGDVWADMVTQQGEYKTRQLWFFARPSEYMDIKIGRQVLTWGTGDLVFLNDLFPKDWQSFFIGRDVQYLKAPSDSLKVSFFPNIASIDIVYTPQFSADNYINGQYISHWNSSAGTLSGNNNISSAKTPDTWFEDDETALRIYKNINNYEYALYGYWGFWKTPESKTPQGVSTFTPLHVYGASVRGAVGKGIINFEIAYYDSRNDPDGTESEIKNSEIKYLAGYTQDVAKELNLSIQYYVEQTLDFENYMESKPSNPKDQFRHVITLQATKLLMQQTLELVFAMYYSPSDEDVYIRPYANYKYTDNINMYLGANIFAGTSQKTFFGQFEKNNNIYAAFRYSF